MQNSSSKASDGSYTDGVSIGAGEGYEVGPGVLTNEVS